MAPQLSLTLVTFSAADPGGWEHLAERARLADQAGIDRLAVSDHVASGPTSTPTPTRARVGLPVDDSRPALMATGSNR